MATSSSELDMDIDVSILEQVKKAIEKVVGAIERDAELSTIDGTESSRQGQAETPEELLERRHRELLQQVQSLESDIEHLEEQIAIKEKSGGNIPDDELEKVILSLAGGSADISGDDLLSKLLQSSTEEENEKLKKLSSQIRLNQAFSGLKFESAEWEITNKDDSGLLREHTHVGTALDDYSFKVVFVAREEKGEGVNSDFARIVFLKVEVDPRAKKDMDPFLTKVCMDSELMTFYQTYVRFCHFHRERTDTFKKAKTKFDSRIHFNEGPNGSKVQFSNDRGVKLIFSWDIKVSVYGNVDQSISLQVKTPPDASSDVVDTLSRVGQLLDDMVQAYGHREGFLQLLTLFEPPSEA